MGIIKDEIWEFWSPIVYAVIAFVLFGFASVLYIQNQQKETVRPAAEPVFEQAGGQAPAVDSQDLVLQQAREAALARLEQP